MCYLQLRVREQAKSGLRHVWTLSRSDVHLLAVSIGVLLKMAITDAGTFRAPDYPSPVTAASAVPFWSLWQPGAAKDLTNL